MKFTKHAVVIALASFYCSSTAMDNSRPLTEIALITMNIVQSAQKSQSSRSLSDSGDFTLDQSPTKRYERLQIREALSSIENSTAPMNQDDCWKKHVYGEVHDAPKIVQTVVATSNHSEIDYRRSKELFFE